MAQLRKGPGLGGSETCGDPAPYARAWEHPRARVLQERNADMHSGCAQARYGGALEARASKLYDQGLPVLDVCRERLGESYTYNDE
jgi:hypothetical protein